MVFIKLSTERSISVTEGEVYTFKHYENNHLIKGVFMGTSRIDGDYIFSFGDQYHFAIPKYVVGGYKITRASVISGSINDHIPSNIHKGNEHLINLYFRKLGFKVEGVNLYERNQSAVITISIEDYKSFMREVKIDNIV